MTTFGQMTLRARVGCVTRLLESGPLAHLTLWMNSRRAADNFSGASMAT
jgi:hypothetical protein